MNAAQYLVYRLPLATQSEHKFRLKICLHTGRIITPVAEFRKFSNYAVFGYCLLYEIELLNNPSNYVWLCLSA